MHDPVINDTLMSAEESTGTTRSEVVHNHVDERAIGCAQGFLVKHASDKLATLNDNSSITWREFIFFVVGVAIGEPVEVDVRQKHRLHLLACPERLRLEDAGNGQLPVKSVEVHHQVHHQIFLNEGIASCEATRAKEGVLHNTHHRLVSLRRHDAARHSHDLLRLSASLHRQVWVWRDNRTGRKVDPLAHEIASYPALLAL
mmetsp:Transcript_35053/g.58033  ORF Transcript_35053/g.58033 Transcript_35053/m.58033 type:complete len:201 (+) Transcript_35053:2878-3480(+)